VNQGGVHLWLALSLTAYTMKANPCCQYLALAVTFCHRCHFVLTHPAAPFHALVLLLQGCAVRAWASLAAARPAATPSRKCVTSTDRFVLNASTRPVWRVRYGALGRSSAVLSTPSAASISVYLAMPSGAGSCTSRASRHCSTIRSVAHLSVHGPHVPSVLTHRQSGLAAEQRAARG
jgi:hypothetical protein